MSSKENKLTCSNCKGTGWEKRDKEFNCKNCNDATKICYLCENANRKLGPEMKFYIYAFELKINLVLALCPCY